MTVNTPPSHLAFDLADALRHLSERDECLKRLIAETAPFVIDVADAQSPYEVLLESIAYQSISGKAAATIFGRIKALGTNGRPPTPEQMRKIPKGKLRKAGLSGAKALAMKDLAKKTLEGIVPTLEEAQTLNDAELVERLICVRGIGAWTVEMFLIFRLGRPDVLPIHDLGVKKGWSVAYGKKHMPKPLELLKFGERCAPTAPSPAGICGARLSGPGMPGQIKFGQSPYPSGKNRKRPQMPAVFASGNKDGKAPLVRALPVCGRGGNARRFSAVSLLGDRNNQRSNFLCSHGPTRGSHVYYVRSLGGRVGIAGTATTTDRDETNHGHRGQPQQRLPMFAASERHQQPCKNKGGSESNDMAFQERVRGDDLGVDRDFHDRWSYAVERDRRRTEAAVNVWRACITGERNGLRGPAERDHVEVCRRGLSRLDYETCRHWLNGIIRHVFSDRSTSRSRKYASPA